MTKYKRRYSQLMIRARERAPLTGYFERHHIVPKAFGGTNQPSNLVKLTYREHFLAHWLLVKMHQGDDRRRMQHALLNMCRVGPRAWGRLVLPWQIAVAKRANRNPMLAETRRKMSASRMGNTNTRGFKFSKEHNEKISKSLLGNTNSVGRKLPPEHIEALRAGHKRYWESRK